MRTLRELKEVVETSVGATLEWHDSEFFGGASWADLPNGKYVSIMKDPPGSTPQIGGTFTLERGENWQKETTIQESVKQLKMIFM